MRDVIRVGRCFIFAAGDFYGLRERPAPGDFVIAADAGYRHCRAVGITPHLLLGDFDSMPEPDFHLNSNLNLNTQDTAYPKRLINLEKTANPGRLIDLKQNVNSENPPEIRDPALYPPHIERVPVEKDDTDTMLALKAGLSRGCDRFYIYGATGGARFDHFIANLQGLLYLRRHGAKGFLYDKNFIWTVIQNEKLMIKREVENALLSIFACDGRAEGVNLSGVQYELKNGVFTPEFPLGVSNHIAQDTARVQVRKGALLIGWEIIYK